ncbi:MAG: FHA domain-containing protein [Verrucomicrobiaceae bacterium]|nr:FHA domain-containing protein [Verrucomicrobiaceae bacterium]
MNSTIADSNDRTPVDVPLPTIPAPILERLDLFDAFWTALKVQPTGPALMYKTIAEQEVHCHELGIYPLVVGRKPLKPDPENTPDLAIVGPKTLSKRHFLISQEEGDYFIEDLGSTHHTHVSSETPIAGRHPLRSGDYIIAGDAVFVFVD